ncbi:MAG: hypothetical protein ACREBW_07005, partial [Candidatus Micrarchaeaceae archaeon]
MSNPVALCTHIKANGIPCGSPAVTGIELCYHHSTVKAALGKVQKGPARVATPIPFVFAEDRTSMQINFFLLLEAFNEQRIDLRTYNALLGLLRLMAKNLGKSGSLVDDREETAESGEQPSSKPTSQKRDVEHPHSQGVSSSLSSASSVVHESKPNGRAADTAGLEGGGRA